MHEKLGRDIMHGDNHGVKPLVRFDPMQAHPFAQRCILAHCSQASVLLQDLTARVSCLVTTSRWEAGDALDRICIFAKVLPRKPSQSWSCRA